LTVDTDWKPGSGIGVDMNKRQKLFQQITGETPERLVEKAKIFGMEISPDGLATCIDTLIGAKDWITEACKASPEASIAWALVSAGLPLLSNAFKARQDCREAFEDIANKMTLYQGLEPLLLVSDQSPTQEDVGAKTRQPRENKIVELYQAILEFLLEAVLRFWRKYPISSRCKDAFKPGRWKDMATNIDRLARDVLESFKTLNSAAVKKNLERLENEVGELKGILGKILSVQQDIQDNTKGIQENTKGIQDNTKGIQDNTKGIQDNTQGIYDEMRSEQEQKCLQEFYLAVDGSNYESFKDNAGEREEDTCQWFLSSDGYKTWKKLSSGLLLVTADPGCGKSVLAKYLTDKVFPNDFGTVCYFFFKDQQQNRLHQALCALLHQLLRKDLGLLKRHALEVYRTEGQKLRESTGSLWRILEAAVRDPETGSLVFVIDALDECREQDFADLMNKLTGFFKHPVDKVKFFMTSRPYTYIKNRLMGLDMSPQYIHIPGEYEETVDEISREIDAVVSARVEKFSKARELKPLEKKHLLDELMKNKGRTYLWVYLVFEDLERRNLPDSGEGIKKMFSQLPTNIAQVYERSLERVHLSDKAEAEKAFQVLLAAERPVTLAEMNAALKIMDAKVKRPASLPSIKLEPEFEGKLREFCGLLVSVHEGNVYFFHQTVREFLLGRRPSDKTTPAILQLNWAWDISLSKAYSKLKALEHGIDEIDQMVLRERDNFAEAIEALTDYTSETIQLFLNRRPVQIEKWEKAIEDLKGEDHARCRVIRLWRESFNLQQAHAALAEICVVYLDLLDPDMASAATSGDKGIFLDYAARYWGHHFREAFFSTEASVLVTKAAKICGPHSAKWAHIYLESRGFGSTTMSDLCLASHFGHEAVVERLLLEGKAEIDSKDSYYGRTPLSWAAENGHEAVVRLLLKGKAEIDSKDSDDRTPLSWAAENGHEAVVRLLLEGKAEIESEDSDGWTPLLWAAANGHEAVVRLLLEGKAEIESEDSHGWTPLSWAATKGHEAVVRLLLKGKAEIDSKDSHYG
jgi:hypothetical protein